jgi:hypothetical protein
MDMSDKIIRRCLALAGMSFMTAFATTAPAVAATWKVQESPNPENAKETRLRGVSCATSTSCVGVGEFALTLKNTGPFKAAGVKWNGEKWTLANPAFPETAASLDGVSCISSTTCVAVGSSGSSEHSPLVEKWSGSSWESQILKTHSGSGKATVLGISCTSSPINCMAGGTEKLPGEGRPEAWWPAGESLKEKEKLEKWRPEEVLLPIKTAPVGQENGVSCSTSEVCMGVGNWGTTIGGEIKPLADRWSPGNGVIAETPPFLSGATNASLNSVSCTGETCTAVGTFEVSGITVPLADSWNGKEWIEHWLPTPSKATLGKLTGISCRSSTECTAVGYYETETHKKRPLADAWNGSAWSLQEPPIGPTGALQSQLQGISCPASKVCDAVGYYGNSSENQLTLVERYE